RVSPSPLAIEAPSFPTRRSSDLCILGLATTYLRFFGTSNIRQRFLTPSCLSLGETARQMVPSPLDSSATMSCASMGLSPRSAHRSEEHTSELQSRFDLVCRLLLE